MKTSAEKALKAGAKVIALAAAKVADKGLTAALMGSAFSPISGAVTSVLCAAVKESIKLLSDETSKIDAKLDLILGEPLKTARQIIEEILSVQYKTVAEVQERERRLTFAFDNLMRAYNYTETRNHDARLIIRIYQAIVAGLKTGGRPFAHLYIGDLYTVVSEARAEAALLRDTAASIDPQFFEEHRGDAVSYAVDWDQYFQLQASVDKTIEDENIRRDNLLAEALRIEKSAGDMESLCLFIRNIADNRQYIFGDA